MGDMSPFMTVGSFLLSLGVMALSATAYGLPLLRRLGAVPHADTGLFRVCAGFGLGLALLFPLSALIHLVLPLDARGRDWAAWCVVLVVPALLLGREIRLNRQEKSFPPFGPFWLPWTLLFLVGGGVAFSTFVFPGSLRYGLGDQVESLALAKSLYRGLGYVTSYLVLDFPQRPEDLTAVVQTGLVRSMPIPSRLPFLPLLSALYFHLFPEHPLVLSCILFLVGAALVPVAQQWVRIWGSRLGMPVALLPLEILVAMALLLPLDPVFLLGFIEAVTLLYVLLAFVLLLRWQNRWIEAFALFLCLIPPLFTKGEGGIGVVLLGLIFILPLFVQQARRAGAATLPLLVMGLAFLAVALPWSAYVARQGVIAHSAVNVFKTKPDGSYQVKNGPFLDLLAERYRVRIDPDHFTWHPSANETLSPLNTFLLELHLKRVRLLEKYVFLYNYMLGVQALGSTLDLATWQPEPWQGRIRIMGEQLGKDFQYLVSVQSGRHMTVPVALGLLMILLLSLLLGKSRWLSIQYTLFFVILAFVLNALNPGVVFFARFLILFLPFLAVLVLMLLSWPVRFGMGKIEGGREWHFLVGLVLVAALCWGVFTKAFTVASKRKAEQNVAQVMEIVQKMTPVGALVSSSLPQYVGALADRQAIGHGDNLLFLTWQVETYRPSHVLIFKRPDWPYDEYALFAQLDKKNILPDYRTVFADPVLHMLILEKK
ncbi:MAG: hypothetical protein HQL65_09740 [Magnetococcales bacterium]|nr:hypothetical protein [Magnetococcales bacterium]